MTLVVFVGPSLPAAAVAAALPGATVAPPAARGDLARAVAGGADRVLLIDGAFAHRRAVSPGEIVAALRAGARVSGAASLGAIRAVDCGPAGMVGVGAVARLFALGVLRDDDEVAVAVEPGHGHRAASVALVNVRFAVLGALRRGELDRGAAGAILTAAKATHFSERTWPGLLARAEVGPSPALRAALAAIDVKRRDAELAVARAAELAFACASRDPEAGRIEATPELGRHAEGRLVRYPGHDPWLGRPPAAAAADLVAWLHASGRRAPTRETVEATVERLRAARELEGELLRRHAVRRGAARRSSADGPPLAPWLAAARAEIARAHGFPAWGSLEVALRGGTGRAVPLAAVRRAAVELALARRNWTASYTHG